jgi:phosphatidylinositol alpha-mannosyltransferase
VNAAHSVTSDRPVRVLHLINGEYFGGSARVLMNYVTAQSRTADVAVGVFYGGELERRLVESGIATTRIRMRGRLDVTASRAVLALARGWQADLIHTHQVRNTLVARLARMLGGPPVVTHVHSPALRETSHRARNQMIGWSDRLLARWSERFIPVSRSLAEELRRTGVPPSRIRFVPNGIPAPPPPDPIVRAAVRRELGVGEGQPLVGMVANFRPRKGTEDLIAAAAMLVRQRVDLRLVLIGEPFREGSTDYGAELAAAARAAGIADRVQLLGFRSDVGRLLAGLDVFVLPSRFGEGMPMVLLEAMGAQVASIATRVEGSAEVIDDGTDGLLAEPRDVAGLAAAIRTLIADPDLRARLAAEGRRKVLGTYTAEQTARGIEAVYADLPVAARSAATR